MLLDVLRKLRYDVFPGVHETNSLMQTKKKHWYSSLQIRSSLANYANKSEKFLRMYFVSVIKLSSSKLGRNFPMKNSDELKSHAFYHYCCLFETIFL